MDEPPRARLVGLIGWPVAHSRSPAIHQAAFRALDLDWVYVLLPVPPDRLARALEGLRSLGFAGANVTMPHKEEAARLVQRRSPEAGRARAVNTVVPEGDELVGHNTDGPGFLDFLREVGFEPSGKTALMLGAGGAARACAVSLEEAGIDRVTAAVRDRKRATLLGEALDASVLELAAFPPGEASVRGADLIVNATPLGTRGESLDLPGMRPGQTVVDLVYEPPATPLVGAARRAGAAAHGGLGMLVRQAARSFELWTGRPAPLEEMAAAAEKPAST